MSKARYLVLKGCRLFSGTSLSLCLNMARGGQCYQTRPESVCVLTDVCGLRVFLNDWLLNKRPLSGGHFAGNFIPAKTTILACP